MNFFENQLEFLQLRKSSIFEIFKNSNKHNRNSKILKLFLKPCSKKYNFRQIYSVESSIERSFLTFNGITN